MAEKLPKRLNARSKTASYWGTSQTGAACSDLSKSKVGVVGQGKGQYSIVSSDILYISICPILATLRDYIGALE